MDIPTKLLGNYERDDDECSVETQSEPLTLDERTAATQSAPLLQFSESDFDSSPFTGKASGVLAIAEATRSIPWLLRAMFFLAFGSKSLVGKLYRVIICAGFLFFLLFEGYQFVQDQIGATPKIKHSYSYFGVWSSLCIEGMMMNVYPTF
jgi:hypothetical protein